MRKSDIVQALVEKSGLSKRQADEAVACAIEHVTNALARGESVDLLGFGSFKVKTRSARLGRHPKTGEPIRIPEGKNVAFKPGKKLREHCRRATDN